MTENIICIDNRNGYEMGYKYASNSDESRWMIATVKNNAIYVEKLIKTKNFIYSTKISMKQKPNLKSLNKIDVRKYIKKMSIFQ